MGEERRAEVGASARTPGEGGPYGGSGQGLRKGLCIKKAKEKVQKKHRPFRMAKKRTGKGKG
jgi:hypothetical protein